MTFFKSLKGLAKFRNEVPVRAWLYRIAANELRMHWRKEKSRLRRDIRWKNTNKNDRICCTQPQHVGEDELHERLNRHVSLLHGLDRLKPRYREALVLRYFEGLKYDEIALVLNKKPGTVKSFVHRGLAALREVIDRSDATF